MKYFILTLILICFCSVQAYPQGRPAHDKPNIIFILADDLGYGDLGFNGQKYIETAVLNKMADEGITFSQFYAGSPVCAPSRAALMTGMHTGHAYIRGNKEIDPEGQEPLADSLVTLAELFKASGYQTGAFGKWGLGFVNSEGDPTRQGFDEFFGYNCQRQSHRYYPGHLWKNQEKVEFPGNQPGHSGIYAPDIIQNEALDFIEKNRDKPFFLFLAYTLPHAELIVPEDSLFTKYKGIFPEAPFRGNDYKIGHTITGYASQAYPRAAYATMVHRLDSYVGQVFGKLKSLGLDENTLVIFTSDNGPASEGGADPVFFESSAKFRGIKRDVYEGGIRVPFVARWPGKITPGTQSSHISALWDILPTLAELAGNQVTHSVDGISMLPSLTATGTQRRHPYLYWEFHEQGGKQALRKGHWKAVRLGVKEDPAAPIALYNLEKDPSETTDLAERHPDKVRELDQLMKEAHKESSLFPFIPPTTNP